MGAGLSTSAPITTSTQQTEAPSNPAQNGSAPVKRKPGRPKGSLKKPTAVGGEHADPTKIKRPVGRPRKDGLPAGSVNVSGGGLKANRPRKSAPGKLGVPQVQISKFAAASGQSAIFGVPHPGPTFRPYYPPNQPPPQAQYQTTFSAGMQQSTSAPPIATIPHHGSGVGTAYHIDPALDRDEWGELLKTNPSALLQALLVLLAAPNPISTAGPSVEEAFKSHLVSLAPNFPQKEEHLIPALYSILKTFWLPSSPAYFSLTASASTARTPSEHRFLYWDPQPLVFNGIACPVCSLSLIHKGRIRSGPMKVYDLENPFFIIGCEYVCKSHICVTDVSPEGRKFASTDSSILRSLPERLREEFPAYLVPGNGDLGSSPSIWNWQATGVSRSLWDMVRGCLRAGIPRDSILTIIKAIQDGFSDENAQMEEEEECEEEDQLEHEQSVPQSSTPVEAQPAASVSANNTKKNGASEAYHKAWKAHSATIDPNPESNNTQVSTSASTGPTMPASSLPVPQPLGFPGGPYPSYQYQPYPQFPLQQQQQPAGQSSAIQSSSHSGTPDRNSLKRPLGFGDAASEVSILEPSQKRTRHCCKCGSQECKGKGGRSFCLNACQDCGKLDCRGRNSRRPDKRCDEAWS